MNINEAVEHLESIIDYEGTEVGEAWQMLLDCQHRRDYISPEFAEALEKEIIKNAEWAQENLVLIESEEIVPESIEKTLSLEYKEDVEIRKFHAAIAALSKKTGLSLEEIQNIAIKVAVDEEIEDLNEALVRINEEVLKDWKSKNE